MYSSIFSGIDNAAVAQSHAVLLFEEAGVLKSRNELVVLRTFSWYIYFSTGSLPMMLRVNDLFKMIWE